MESQIATQYRDLFPVLENVTYLNSCSQGALAIPVRDALNQYLDGMYAKGSLWDQWVMKLEELRDLVAVAFETRRTNVAITTTASAGINSVLSSFDFSSPRNRIITTDLEFPTMGQILHAQERRGAEVIHISSDQNGLLNLAEFEEALDDRVALVAVTHVCYRNGAMTDIKSVTDLAHKYNIPVLVDAYQSAGSMPISFSAVGADFMVGGFLKYMLGIPGIGFLLAKEDSELIPTKTGWFAAQNVFDMDINSYAPALDARRFEEGTPPIPSVYGAVAGLKIILELGLTNIENFNRGTHTSIRKIVEGMGIEIVTPKNHNSHGIMIALRARDVDQAVEALEEEQVVVSARGSNVRISPHFYNTEEDVISLALALKKCRFLFSTVS